jgi:twitching motility protein PilT
MKIANYGPFEVKGTKTKLNFAVIGDNLPKNASFWEEFAQKTAESATDRIIITNEVESTKTIVNYPAVAGDYCGLSISSCRSANGYEITIRRIVPHELPLESFSRREAFTSMLAKQRGVILVSGRTCSGRTNTLTELAKLAATTGKKRIMMLLNDMQLEYPLPRTIGETTIIQRLYNDYPDQDTELIATARNGVDLIICDDTPGIRYNAENCLVVGVINGPISCIQVIDDIIAEEATPKQEERARQQLARSLVGIIGQRLIDTRDGEGQTLAMEVMVTTPAIQNLIREDKSFRIKMAIQTGHKYGMNLFDEDLIRLARNGSISIDAALAATDNPEELARELIPETTT